MFLISQPGWKKHHNGPPAYKFRNSRLVTSEKNYNTCYHAVKSGWDFTRVKGNKGQGDTKHRNVLGKERLQKYLNLCCQNIKGKKSVIVLSTIYPFRGVTKDDDKKKPAAYKIYDFTKGGTDIVDQKMSFYSCKTKSRNWSLVVFGYLLDTIRVNSAALHALNRNMDPKKQSSFESGYSLAEQLLLPQIRTRNKNGLASNLITKLEIDTGEVNAKVENPEPNKPGR